MNGKISITGDLGSGKSTIAKILAEEFKAKYLSTGAIQRNIASRYNMSTLEMNKYADLHKEIDDEIDNVLRDLNTSDKRFVIDSRLAWFFIPTSFKLYFTTDVEVAAKRVLNDSTRVNEDYSTVEEAIENIKERKKSENERFSKLYNADCADFNSFDLILNTTELKTVVVSQFIADVVSGKIKNSNQVIWCNPEVLFPTDGISALANETKNEPITIENPILVTEKQGALLIVDGHKRVSDALRSKIPVIPVKIVTNSNLSCKQTNEWSDFHGFTFYKNC
jgi:CMP/dCMP kinase